MSKKVFIIGNPRSGTTLLRIILNANPNIIVPPECGFAIWLYPKYKNWSLDSLYSGELELFITDLLKTKKIETWKLNKKIIYELLLLIKPKNYADLVESIYSIYAYTKNKINYRIWGDKNNFYLHHIEEINKLFSNAYYIYIVRDCRDVVCSYQELHKKKVQGKYAPQLPFDVSSIATEWTANNYKIIKSFENIKVKNRLKTIKYEDLVLNTSKTAKDICNFLEIEYDEAMEKYFMQKNDEPKEFLKWKQKINSRPDPSSIKRYLHDLTKSDINSIENIAKSLLIKFNYL